MLLAGLLAFPLTAEAQKPIKVGFPMILSGAGALFGEPALKGAKMYVEELNAKGGVLGRKLEIVARDTKGNADEAVRVSRELILKENVDFLVGTLTSAEGPAVSVVAKENKMVFIAPIPKTNVLHARDIPVEQKNLAVLHFEISQQLCFMYRQDFINGLVLDKRILQ